MSMTILAPALMFSALASKDFDIARQRAADAGQRRRRAGLGPSRVAVARLMHVDYRTLVPTAMFNNCGNMGLPLAVLAFGQAGFSAMVALFTISNLLHFTLGVRHHRPPRALRPLPAQSDGVGDRRSASSFALTHPPMPEWVYFGIKMVGDALIPMMLLVARRAPVRGALGRLAARRRRRHRVSRDGHRDGARCSRRCSASIRCSAGS